MEEGDPAPGDVTQAVQGEGRDEGSCKRQRSNPPARVADWAKVADVEPFVKAVDKRISLVSVKLDTDRSRGQIRVLVDERVCEIYAAMVEKPLETIQRVSSRKGT